MNKTHLCDCPNCGLANAVELKQAGQSLVCSGCRKSFEAPKLRELKLLPLVEPANDQSAARSDSSKRAGSSPLFAIGLAMAVIAGSAGGALYRFATNLAPSVTADEYVASQNKLIDEAPVNQLYARWEELYEQRHVPEWHESEVKSLFKQGGYLKTIALGLLSVAGCGLLITGFSLFSSRRQV